MANREEGAAVPNQRQGQEQPQPQDTVGQRHILLTGQILSQNFQGNQKRMQKHIYYIQTTGWMLIVLMKI